MEVWKSEPNPRWLLIRRLTLLFGLLASVAFIAWRALAVLEINGLSALKMIIFVLFLILLIPVAYFFWTSVAGFVLQWRINGKSGARPGDEEDPPENPNLPRTALVMPVYNEDPVRVFAGLKVMYEDLEEADLLKFFDLCLMSDTTNPDIWVQEEMAFAELRRHASHPDHLIYRNRRENLERKAGNIADFCARWGKRYEYMILLDADSIMTAQSMLKLVLLMEKNPRTGIVQTSPLPVNRLTLFGRLHQFAMHAYSGIFNSGLSFWQGATGNYWGHNAIIRIRPFVEHCRLPVLPGKQPRGGHILSHDFIEAALMRRAGWNVCLATELDGSYEEMPASLLGSAARDQRWCQGNLQHGRLVSTPGFHLISRIHICIGIISYLASPLWLILLALTTAEALKESLARHQYFGSGQTLFPNWPVSVHHQAVIIFALMMALLLVPKFLSLILHLRNGKARTGFGGGPRLICSVLLEAFASALLAPNLAFQRTRFVLAFLRGKSVGWEAQDRGETETTFRQAFRRHWPNTFLGIAWSALLWATVPKIFLWFSPVIVGFLLVIPLSVWTSRTNLGHQARRGGLFLIPDELAPSEILRRLRRQLEVASRRPWAEPGDGLARVFENREICDLHLSLLSSSPAPKHPLQQHYLAGLLLKVRHQGDASLSLPEKRQLLLDADSIRQFVRQPGIRAEPMTVNA